MSSLLLPKSARRTLGAVVQHASKTFQAEGARTLATTPHWDVDKLVENLNKIVPKNPDKGDNAAALRLYKQDVKASRAFYDKTACEVMLPHMANAGSQLRAQSKRVPGHVTLVGAAGGMGREIAKKAAVEGANLTLVDMPGKEGGLSPALKALADECTLLAGEGRVHAIGAHVTQDTDMVRAMQEARDFHNSPTDFLGITVGMFRNQRSHEVTASQAAQILNVNARSTLVTVNAAIPHLLDSRNPVVMFITSLAGREFIPNQGLYCWSKHHQHNSMALLGDMLSSHLGIRTTELLLGHVATEMAQGRGLDTAKMLQPRSVAELMWHIAEAPPQARFKELDVVPTQRLEGKVPCPQKELARLSK